MELTEHVESIRRQFAAAAEAGGDEAKAQAEGLFAPLESAIHLRVGARLGGVAAEGPRARVRCEPPPVRAPVGRGRGPRVRACISRGRRGGHCPHQPPSPRAPEGAGGRGSRKRRPLDQHLAGSRHESGSRAKQSGSSPRPTATNWISAIHRLEPVVRRERK